MKENTEIKKPKASADHAIVCHLTGETTKSLLGTCAHPLGTNAQARSAADGGETLSIRTHAVKDLMANPVNSLGLISIALSYSGEAGKHHLNLKVTFKGI